MTAARIEHTATLLNDGRVLIAGGNIGSNASTPLAELYTPTVLVPVPALLSLTGDGPAGRSPARRDCAGR